MMTFRSEIIGVPMGFIGEIASVNSWHMVGNGRIFEGPSYRQSKEAMSLSFMVQWRGTEKITTQVDLYLTVSLWKMKDTDGCLKPIIDSLEEAGIIMNDRLIRNIGIAREYHAKSETDSVYVMFLKIEEEDDADRGL